MGTRLYPMTKDTALLEKLAEVPPGTAAALERFEAVTAALTDEQLLALTGLDVNTRGNGRHCAIYKLREAVEEIANYDSFITFGWGKFQGHQLVAPANRVCNGTTDLALVKQLLQAQGVTLPDGVTTVSLGGLCWL
jgi:hypothetical protein